MNVEVKCTRAPEHIRISIKTAVRVCRQKAVAALSAVQSSRQETPRGRDGYRSGVTSNWSNDGRQHRRGKQVGVGSEFWIELIGDVSTACRWQCPTRKIGPQAQDNAVLRTLLYVEDNPANLMLVEQIIADHPMSTC